MSLAEQARDELKAAELANQQAQAALQKICGPRRTRGAAAVQVAKQMELKLAEDTAATANIRLVAAKAAVSSHTPRTARSLRGS